MSQDPVEDLRQEIEKGHVLVVVGSGVSLAATNGNPLASWTGLLKDGVERCVKVKGLDARWANRVREEIDSGDMDDLLSAAEKISSKLGFPDGGEYRRWLRETVGGLQVQDRSVLEALKDLSLPLATTNYDGLIEEITGLSPVTWLDGDRIAQAILRDEPAIIHLHGHWKEPKSVILGLRSYERILSHGHAQALLRAVQTLHTLLFVGCGDGLSDPNFGALLDWARGVFKDSEVRHYRLCLDGEAEKFRKQHKDDRLHPLPYGPKHSNLLRFLQDLKPPGKKSAAPSPPPAASAPSLLPPKPRCFGRDDEVRDLVETLLQPSSPPTPILGGPGSGKTIITQIALHDRRVAERFRARRFFVRCDGATTREALVSEIARVVGIEPGTNPEASLFQALAIGPTLLVLDNAETPWEGATSSVEELLSALSSVDGLALIASIRGDQRPLGPSWRSSIRVGPLGLEAARDAFLAIAGEKFRKDPDLNRLLEAVDRLALAITLLAHEAEGEPNLSGLWRRWQTRRTVLLQYAGGRERLTNIEVSLDLSWNGPRMTSAARRLLSVMALLPDGVAHEDLDALMPGEADEAVSALRKVSLGFDQGNRLRVLAPVREYVRGKHKPVAEDLDRAVDSYLEIACTGDLVGEAGGAEAARKLVQELGNLDAMISKGLEREDPEPAILAACDLGWLNCGTGWGSGEPLDKALTAARSIGRKDLEARSLERLGDIAFSRSDHDAARARNEEALSLYRNVGDVRGEANCIWSLGDIALERSDYDAARARYEEALSLYRNVGHVRGEANCIWRLGDIALKRLDLDVACARYEEALPLYRNVDHVLGEANCIWRLGDIALGRSDHDAARARYEEALPLFKNIGHVLGEANCILSLGDIARARSEWERAKQGFHEALELYGRIPEPYSIGRTKVRLALLEPEGSSERRCLVEEAREAWESIKRPDLVEWLKTEFGDDFEPRRRGADGPRKKKRG